MANESWKKLCASIAFGTLFLSALSGFTLGIVVLSSERPWHLDETATFRMLDTSNNNEVTTFDDWLNSLGPEEENMKLLLSIHYRFAAMCIILVACVVLAVLFLAPQNKPLVTCLQLLIVIWTGLVFSFRSLVLFKESHHVQLVFFVFASNLFGFFIYRISQFASRRDEDVQDIGEPQQKQHDQTKTE
eukprot:TRINITY_DN6380_c0_g1::TRINITY_DN6380_c0_g1_i1::g.568::m.568 TRINITY_DN6380_c0_g1::TRINITY_DN6380_c0_g1_i1::g.568  ORF type:complete len:188 (+),score=5.90,PepSY_TM_3/PF13706.1/6.5e+03,PepSY_TM_3/PF13706.1/4.5e+03,PepSY_TM_3/PF13706.1/8.2e+02,PepSY_TM_3/PF13706.1/0.011,Ni_hydr_CYTB/PF01292.15/0.035,Ni_hydr_CYTB/PF01292.15/3.8e+02,DUF2842/PF11003.3/8e+02,DUF2842/PF11003.3/0.052,HERV-K_env_2/PF13804.1/0.19,DUF788/PF05620.6/4.8e+02,DUF788/PF05620.6/8.1e+02,DUF788/PF05620.6/0.84,DUF4131/PF13567.1/5.6